MYIYNVTTYVHWSIHEAWVQWMQQERIPAIIETGCFRKFQLVRVLETDETEGPTYAVQYFSESKDDYLRYRENHEPALQAAGHSKWGAYCISFSSLMEVLH
ncbi:DUF4286 family protein [Paraflavitalea speifideaquila]|uniref:DUF4286 family protein n=1 Tax=Paraflavitalea speifideaquila TaxID=3076558 RepID=UPI0028EA4492|nr:DUF4286 family protein [Paraflavitalea speifideiaquila]